MKTFKLAILLFVVSFIFSLVGVKADDYMSFLDITLPKSDGIYEYGNVYKSRDNFQYYHSDETKTDGFPFGRINVVAKTKGGPLNYKSTAITLSAGQEKTWGDQANVFVGNYSIVLERGNYSIFTASHWGHWMLDGGLAGTI